MVVLEGFAPPTFAMSMQRSPPELQDRVVLADSIMVPPTGFEPSSLRVSISCATNYTKVALRDDVPLFRFGGRGRIRTSNPLGTGLTGRCDSPDSRFAIRPSMVSHVVPGLLLRSPSSKCQNTPADRRSVGSRSPLPPPWASYTSTKRGRPGPRTPLRFGNTKCISLRSAAINCRR